MPYSKNPFIKYFLDNQILVAIAVVAFLYLIFLVREILVLIFVSYIIMAALYPLVAYLEKKKISRVAAVLLIYLILIIIMTVSIFPLIPFFTSQIQSLFKNFPSYLGQASKTVGLKTDAQQIDSAFTQVLGSVSQNAFAVTTVVFGGFFTIITIFVVSFYLLLDHEHMKQTIVGFFPKPVHKSIYETVELVEEKLGAWFRGQIILSLLIGLFTWIGYTLLGLDFALPLALLAGLFEAVPTIGPFLGAVPAVIVALTISPAKTLLVIIVYIIIQVLESNLLVPKIMERAVGLSPIIIIIAILAGAKLMGLWGALLAIPFTSMLVIIYQSMITEKEG